jgi:hypothetical protein
MPTAFARGKRSYGAGAAWATVVTIGGAGSVLGGLLTMSLRPRRSPPAAQGIPGKPDSARPRSAARPRNRGSDRGQSTTKARSASASRNLSWPTQSDHLRLGLRS